MLELEKKGGVRRLSKRSGVMLGRGCLVWHPTLQHTYTGWWCFPCVSLEAGHKIVQSFSVSFIIGALCTLSLSDSECHMIKSFVKDRYHWIVKDPFLSSLHRKIHMHTHFILLWRFATPVMTSKLHQVNHKIWIPNWSDWSVHIISQTSLCWNCPFVMTQRTHGD